MDNNTFTKADLKTGMVVTTRNGRKYIVLLNIEADSNCNHSISILLSQNNDGWNNLEDYGKNLKMTSNYGENGEWDIVKVEIPNYLYAIFNFFTQKEDINSDNTDDNYKFTTIWEEKTMKKFVIRVVEELATTVIIEAENLEDAIDKAQELHKDGEIELDYDNLSDSYAEEAETNLKTAKELGMPEFE